MDTLQLSVRFNALLDRLLEGEVVHVGPEESKEYREMIEVARELIKLGSTSTDDLLHQRLLYSLLQQFHEESMKKSESDEELQDSDLSMVAGGTGNHGSKIGCSKCDCPLMAQDIPGPLCKECGHSRGDHNECTNV